MSFYGIANISDSYCRILLPALKDAVARKFVNEEFYSVLSVALKSQTNIIQSADLANVFPGKSSSDRSRIIKSLIDAKMLAPIKPGARKYYPVFSNNYLLRSILRIMDVEGLLPVNSGMNKIEATVKHI